MEISKRRRWERHGLPPPQDLRVTLPKKSRHGGIGLASGPGRRPVRPDHYDSKCTAIIATIDR